VFLEGIVHHSKTFSIIWGLEWIPWVTTSRTTAINLDITDSPFSELVSYGVVILLYIVVVLIRCECRAFEAVTISLVYNNIRKLNFRAVNPVSTVNSFRSDAR